MESGEIKRKKRADRDEIKRGECKGAGRGGGGEKKKKKERCVDDGK